MGNLVFSSRQQRALLGSHGSPTHDFVEHHDRPTETVRTTRKANVAHVYESEDGESIVVCTGKGSVRFDDAVDLGPGGRHLHAYPADGAWPVFPMVLPRDRLADLINLRLTPEETARAREAAAELAERVAAEAGSPAP